MRNVRIVALAGPAIFLANMLAIIYEEQYLQETFGQSYLVYRKKVGWRP